MDFIYSVSFVVCNLVMWCLLTPNVFQDIMVFLTIVGLTMTVVLFSLDGGVPKRS